MSYYTPTYPRPNGTLSDSNTKTPLRKHDAVAILTCLLLLRLSFHNPHEFGDVTASIDLEFYAPNAAAGRAARPVPIDIDGDGAVDALVVPAFARDDEVSNEREAEMASSKRKGILSRGTDSSREKVDASWGEGTWGLRVLNLKPLHVRNDEERNGPFRPRTMFLSPLQDGSASGDDSKTTTTSSEKIHPIKLLPIQIPITRNPLGEEERIRQRHKKEGYGSNPAIPPKDEANKDYDRTRHYFCGRDWHHAASSCHRHCESGLSGDCGEGEQCYADTPCDAMLPLDNTSKETNTTEMALTIRGTLPGITTVWSDGSVTLHAITADVVASATNNDSNKHDHRGKRERQRKKKPELELRQLWRVFPLIKAGGAVTFEELGLTFESGVIYGSTSSERSNDKNGNNEAAEQNRIGSHGAILLGGRYTVSSEPKVSFHALDAFTGASLWELDGSRGWSSSKRASKTSFDTEFPIPIIHTTSSARRRSHLPVKDTMDPELDNENSFMEGEDVLTTEECLAHFRTSVFDEANGALPHEFWDGDFGSMNVGRFERAKKSPRKKSRTLHKQLLTKDALVGRGRDGSVPRSGGLNGQIGGMMGSSRGRGGESGMSDSTNWQTDFLHRAIPQRLINRQKYDASHPRMGKPNVVMFHGRDGLAVLSLKNGRPVCHISLVNNALYADMDRDGVVDVVQVVTSPEGISRSGQFHRLIQRIEKSKNGEEIGKVYNKSDGPVFCHALVTSGLPPREEVFTAPLCLGGPLMSIDPKKPQLGLRAAPPLLVEGSLGYGNDVVFAMNNGVVARYDSNGREVWRKNSSKDGTPSWHSSKSAFLGRVQFGAVKSHSSVSASSHRNQHRPGSPVRPILLSGEDGAAVISPASGKVLSSVVYPQSAVAQPLLADLDGDGTDDLLVVSADAIWGYRVVVETGRSGIFSIVVVTLVVGVALSALIHKTSQTSRRSMDA